MIKRGKMKRKNHKSFYMVGQSNEDKKKKIMTWALCGSLSQCAVYIYKTSSKQEDAPTCLEEAINHWI